MNALIVHVDDHGVKYDCLAFVCPGCVAMDGKTGLHMLPVNTDKTKPAWSWDGNLERPTVSPSIRTKYESPDGTRVCHSFLNSGVFQFLDDCTHSLVGQYVDITELPEWFIEERT